MSVSYLLAWLLPWMTGTGICLAVGGRGRQPGAWASAMGSGFLLGLFLAAALAALVAGSDTQQAFARTAPWLAAIGLLAWIAALTFRGVPKIGRISLDMPKPALFAASLLLLAILWHLSLTFNEAMLRPTFPWDAWSAWAVKPKAWFLLGHHVEYVPMADWLSQPNSVLRTIDTWNYPELLAWVQIWFASAAGAWNEPLINVAWTGAMAAIGLACVGHWRALGVPMLLALGLCYALLSLPLLGAHAALAGYADLWLAAAFGMAVLYWLRWQREGGKGLFLLAVLFALCLPAIKLEGAVWMLLLFAVAALVHVPARWRWGGLGATLGLVGIGFAVGGFSLPVPGLGWITLRWGEIVIPALGQVDLHWRPVGREMLAGLLTLPNWHLLWYALPMVVLWRRKVLMSDPATRQLGALLACCAGSLFVLFFFTDASAWAENFTSSNRLVMHIVPACFSLIALLMSGAWPASPDRPSAPVEPTHPG